MTVRTPWTWLASLKLSIKFVALKKTIEEKDLGISGLETSLGKLEKSYQEEVRDLKNDIVDLKERVTDREIYNSEETIIINNPPEPNGKTCVEVMVDFVNHFFNAKIARASLEACHFLNKIVESANTVKFSGKENYI